MKHVTHCALRLGDNLAHLHFLRKLAEAYPRHEFEHWLHGIYRPQCADVVLDLKQITLRTFPDNPSASRWWMSPEDRKSVDAWKNTNHFWQRHPLRNDYARFMLAWFKELAERMGLRSPLTKPEHLLFDYPMLKPPCADECASSILVVNSNPMSGRIPGFDSAALDRLAIHINNRAAASTSVSGDLIVT